jgi:hypothetical protein
VNIITQERVDTVDDMRKSEFDSDFSKADLSSVKPSEDEPIRAIVLTGEELDQLTSEDWNRVSYVLGFFQTLMVTPLLQARRNVHRNRVFSHHPGTEIDNRGANQGSRR